MIGKKIVDLSLPYSSRISGFSKSTAKTVQEDGWNATNLELYSHAGTHMDAPFHFGVSDKTIDDFDPQRFVISCHKVSVEVDTDSYLITSKDVEKTLLQVKPSEGLIIQTGWSQHLGQDRYRNGLPRISVDLAHELASARIGFIGVEPPSVADVNDIEEVTKVHQILLAADIIIVEGLTNLDALPMEPFTLIALPLKIKDGDGAPARVVAVI